MSIPGTRNGPGRPKTGARQIHLQVRPELLAALESWMATEPGAVSHPEAVRRLMTLALMRLGHLAG